MRRAALSLVTAASVLSAASAARAECRTPQGYCVDAEPLWISPSSRYFTSISDAEPTPSGKLAASASFDFRWQPAVVNAPSPSSQGRDVNVIRHSTDISLSGRWGIGNRMELTLVLPAGLYQRGAGIKGVTYQAAEPIARQTLHDPRLGFGFSLPPFTAWLDAKLRFELKLPLGSEAALSGEHGFVASPSLALRARQGGIFAGLELGARLRQSSDFYQSRVGSQAMLALGLGYELARPRLALAIEAYALPSLIAPGSARHLPAEWLASLLFTPESLDSFCFGAGGGSGLPLSADAHESYAAFGVPSYRLQLFVRFSPSSRD